MAKCIYTTEVAAMNSIFSINKIMHKLSYHRIFDSSFRHVHRSRCFGVILSLSVFCFVFFFGGGEGQIITDECRINSIYSATKRIVKMEAKQFICRVENTIYQ